MLEILKEWVIANPVLSVIIISAAITLIMTLVTKYVTDQNRMKELKEIQKACNIRVKENKNNPEELSKVNKEIMECSMELMKHSMKPMLYTFLPLILIFFWIRGTYAESSIAGSWLWYYIGTSIVSSIIFRKIFKVI